MEAAVAGRGGDNPWQGPAALAAAAAAGAEDQAEAALAAAITLGAELGKDAGQAAAAATQLLVAVGLGQAAVAAYAAGGRAAVQLRGAPPRDLQPEGARFLELFESSKRQQCGVVYAYSSAAAEQPLWEVGQPGAAANVPVTCMGSFGGRPNAVTGMNNRVLFYKNSANLSGSVGGTKGYTVRGFLARARSQGTACARGGRLVWEGAPVGQGRWVRNSCRRGPDIPSCHLNNARNNLPASLHPQLVPAHLSR